MTNGTDNTETPRQKLAQSARQDDMKAANDGARTAAQTSVLINGGAATAILAFLSNYLTKSPTVPASIPFSIPLAGALALFGYALGVCLGAWSMWCASQASGQFGLRWEAFLDGKANDETNYLSKADVWLERHRNSFGFSIVLFLVSSGAMAYGFLASVK